MKLGILVPWLYSLAIVPSAVRGADNGNNGQSCEVYKITPCAKIRAYTDQELAQIVEKRFNPLVARATTYTFCSGDAAMKYSPSEEYYTGGQLFDYQDWNNCDDYTVAPKGMGTSGQHGDRKYIAEHILERQTVKIFFDENFRKMQGNPPSEKSWCKYIKKYWDGSGDTSKINGKKPMEMIAEAFPAEEGSAWAGEMVRLDSDANGAKERMFEGSTIHKLFDDDYDSAKGLELVIGKLRSAVLVAKYMDNGVINGYFHTQAQRLATVFNQIEDGEVQNWQNDPAPYVRVDVGDKWLKFMKDFTVEMNNELKAFLQGEMDRLKDQITKGKDRRQKDAELDKLYKRLEAIVKELNDMLKPGSTMFKNPF